MARKDTASDVIFVSRQRPSIPKAIPLAIRNQAHIPEVFGPDRIENGLADVVGIGGGDMPFGYPMNQGFPGSEQVSQPTTIFRNLRWFLVSNMRQMLNEAYVELGLVQAVVNLPVDDAYRGGIEFKSKQLNETELEQLQISIDRDDDIGTLAQAEKWNRLFGGAGVLILTDQDPETPLEIDQIDEDSDLEFRAVDMWELFWDKQGTEGYDPSTQTHDTEFYSYYGVQVHHTRVMKLKGMEAPSFIRPRLRGWGFSCVEILVRSINQYLKATDVGFEVLDEFKLDIYKIKNLTASMGNPKAEEAVKRRISIANYTKNYQNAIVMDKEDDYDHKQLSFSGLGDAMAGIRMQVASDMRMPLSKLFGTSAVGFGSGEDDLEVYNAMVESQVRNKGKYPALRIAEIKCQKLFGFVPDDLSVHFKPLRVLSAVDEETVKTQKFTRLNTAYLQGDIDEQEYKHACNKGNLFDIKLDTSDDLLDGDTADSAEDDGADPDKDTDTDDPGANRTDSRKPKASSKGGIPKGGPVKSKKVSNSGVVLYMKKKSKVMNTITIMPQPFTRFEKVRRLLNSPQFDKASYEADGGDAWINPNRKYFFMNPKNVDRSLWWEAERASRAALGEERWQFMVWYYKKIGGEFFNTKGRVKNE